MAQLGGTFDASQVDPNQPHETLPPGEYRVQIIASEMRVTKAGTGQYLFMEMEILDGAMAGKKLFDRLNLINPNRQAEEIAQRTLSAICHAVGRMQVTDSEELHFKPLVVKVVVDKEGYNQTKGYKAVANAAQAPQQAFQPPPPRHAAQYQTQPQPAQVPQPQAAQYQSQPQAVPQPQPAQYQSQPQTVPQPQPAQYQAQAPQPQPAQYQAQVPQPQPVQQPAAQVPNPAPSASGVGPWRRMG
ncbi:MAG: DUF669 domain-containing protein [Magnetococcales bacterium]|nr:DUF669 domain-containing protein [Magnetococcales bacterium]MBF0116598.1 DUF669 domain-containing protein [Magnetococcales bacterium]